MLDTSEQVKDALIDVVAELARARTRDIDPDQAERALREYYRRAAAQDIAGRDPSDLYASAVRHWQLGHQREAGTANVRVYNPSAADDGWQTPHTVIDIVTDDMPFIVDSVTEAMRIRNLNVHVLIHPMASITRNADGVLTELSRAGEGGEGSVRESYVHLEIDRIADGQAIDEITEVVQSVLDDVRTAVEDWVPMRRRALALADELEAEDPPVDPSELAEASDLLRWLADDHFTFIGYREYLFSADNGTTITSMPETGLGILRQSDANVRDLHELPPEIAELARRPMLLNLTKANRTSTVHRAVPLDYIGVKKIGSDGRVLGERRFLGLFTSDTYSGSVQDLPVVRKKVAEVTHRAGFQEGTHDASRLLNILEQYPRDELFQISVDDLEHIALGILDMRDRRSVTLFVRRDDYGRFLSCLVFVPRDRHNTDVRLRIQEILMEAYGGTHCRFSTEISDAPLARLHLVIYTGKMTAEELPDLAAVQERLSLVIRTWDDAFRSALVSELGEDKGLRLFTRYADALPASYREDCLPEAAVADVLELEQLDGIDLAVGMHRPLEAGPDELRCKLYVRGQPINLSDIIPVLHDLGAEVIDERPHEIDIPGEVDRFIYDIGLLLEGGLDHPGRERFEEAVLAAWTRRAESDGFACLVTRAGLGWRDVVVLRAYARYLRQIGTPYTPAYVQDTLAGNPHIAAGLVALFRARFDPSADGSDGQQQLQRELGAAIDQVSSLDEDRILRRFLAMVLATVRTNHFVTDPAAGPDAALALKLDPGAVPDLPRPIPAHEIWVYSPRVEGVHLRGGRVARGGLRWSDRRDDFRTEVLGLMKAQTVKNSVIVPVGAKGGFVVKTTTLTDREARAAEVVACYGLFIHALLDVTDNLVGGEVTPPPEVVRHDGDDPYLVVAADKGTATFSDIANEIAVSRGFWLGDAFASGGSVGYDHKKLGITARGAWRSVERHFRGLGVDVSAEPFTVAGVGDMSGDVFGNGMLQSPHIRLVAAFDHRHVFVDPDPDPATSFAERLRLFGLPASTWDSYDRDLISPGGGVFDRSAKAVELSPQMRAALGTDAEVLTPNELIRAVLRAPVDLLFNGGIGTYVKASSEHHDEVGDRANDPVRVDASEVRAKVVAEGGNLGLTQPARVELARAGTRLNTDAIDNSAGVDCSDHEVNIKILLDMAVADGDLTGKQRDELLRSVADDVCDLVLEDNYAQNEALAAAEALAPGMVDVHARHLGYLERAAGLDRLLEALPSDDELSVRRQADSGLSRPELAVLLAYTKNAHRREVEATSLPDDPAFSPELRGYFPAPVVERHGDLVDRHPLRRELVSMLVVNQLVNRGGISMARRLVEETGASIADIARAHTAGWRLFDLESLWHAIRGLDNDVQAAVQVAMQLEAKRLGERTARWLLRNAPQPIDIGDILDAYAEPVATLGKVLPDLLLGRDRLDFEIGEARLRDADVPDEIAGRVAGLGLAFATLDLTQVAQRTGAPLELVASVYFQLDDRLDLGWLRQSVLDLPRDDLWPSRARSALRDDFYREHAELTAGVVATCTNGIDGDPVDRADGIIDDWATRNQRAVDRCRQTFQAIRSSGGGDELARTSVALRELRQLVRSST